MTDTVSGRVRVALADNTVGRREIDAVRDVLDSRWLTAGEVTREFEDEFGRRLGAPGCVAVSSGTAALHLAMLALGLRAGDEVIVPSLSFVASAAVVALHGGVPVFADVRSPTDLTLAPEEVERLIGERTKAVVVMHYGGHPAQVRRTTRIARAAGIAVVEDVAHAPLVPLDGRMLGTFGDIGCFSFHATKNMTTGEGGMITARDPALLDRVRRLRSHCVEATSSDGTKPGTTPYDVFGVGLNYRPTEISSALGQAQLSRLAADRAHRGRLVRRYREGLAALPGVTVPFADRTEDSAHHLMTVLLPPGSDRSAVRGALLDRGVQTSVHYPPSHLLSYYRDDPDGLRRDASPREHLPVTESVAGRLLTLPLHSRMSDTDADLVTEELAAALAPAAERS
ncbi:MAG: DegT/DnrJ/EryC1/StrS family aminotransferase [Streptomyces sp.]|nr:DegT/DnrJ/EryC1/StrS family aminotransferase [Streptomyces sp.]NUS11143.1 DegT/DnrJ/EryC1/StrS family aminotransferase [Streptomyces sp.]NUS23667.1 DegT/DnrJ/EryC1/StrS family aminotransferase [Streptomyces sp.]NUS76395.1 DegT/DnrJ/EryC1/StrS family aminotransferase [Streptomyces sp.]